MDDMQTIERRVAREMLRQAGPSLPVDDAAIFTAVASTSRKLRFQAMFSAARFVVAGAIVALFGGLLLAGVFMQPSDDVVPAVDASAPATVEPEATASTAASPEADRDDVATTTIRSDLLPGVDLITEEIEPGVVRIISDGAGHDLDEARPMYGTRKDGIAVTPDGTVWLTTAYTTQSGDWSLSASPSVWALGKPGALRIPEGVWTATETPILLVSDVDGELFFIADSVVRFDGETFVPDDGPWTRRLRAGGMVWLIGKDELAGLIPEGEFEFLCGKCGVLPVIWDGWKWISLSEYGSRVLGTSFGSAPLGTACWTDGDGVACADAERGEAWYLEGTPPRVGLRQGRPRARTSP